MLCFYQTAKARTLCVYLKYFDQHLGLTYNSQDPGRKLMIIVALRCFSGYLCGNSDKISITFYDIFYLVTQARLSLFKIIVEA